MLLSAVGRRRPFDPASLSAPPVKNEQIPGIGEEELCDVSVEIGPITGHDDQECGQWDLSGSEDHSRWADRRRIMVHPRK